MANGAHHEFLTLKEAATAIRMGTRFLARLIRKKRGPKVVYFGRNIRIPTEEFQRWTREGTRGK